MKRISRKDNLRELLRQDFSQAGREMHAFMAGLFPICRSITGKGLRQTLQAINRYIKLRVVSVASGTRVFDWTVPDEWNIRDAYVKDCRGRKVIDFKDSNLHLLGYSLAVNKKVALAELKKHLYTLPEYPEWIPYHTSYYNRDWGFCLEHKKYLELKDGIYEVFIDSALKKGFLDYGEFLIKGRSSAEVLFSTYICHPSLCNDNLSGVVVMVFLARALSGLDLKYSYRFLFIPETIGSICWLSRNRKAAARIKHGLIATCLGDGGKMSYKKSRQGNAPIDRAVEKVLSDSGEPFKLMEFVPNGSDERQFCSPGFNLPVGSLMRTPYGEFPQYHTSADNLDFVQPEALGDSLGKYLSVIEILEGDARYMNLNPECEPQLGRRGLYRKIGGDKKSNESVSELAIFWVLNLSDGNNSLLDIAIRSGLKFRQVREAADALTGAGLLKKTTDKS